MLDNLKRYLVPVNPIVVPQWVQHVENMKVRRDELRRRFMNDYGYSSRALRILKHVAGSIDTSYLKYQVTDFDAYRNYFSEFGDVADYIFNPTKFGKAYRNMFYEKTVFSTTEYIIPTNDVDHIKTLPLGKGWDEWKNVKPVTLWYHDSSEHTLDLLHNEVKFRHIQPTYSVTYIDSVALSMMWWKYSNLTTVPDEDKILEVFLHRYVFSKLFEDLEDIYLTNRIRNILTAIDNDIPYDNLYGYVDGRQKEADSRLGNRLQELKDGNIRPNNLLSSKLLCTGSILDRIHHAFTYLDTDHLYQYEYTRILRDLPYLDIILTLHEYRKDSDYYKNLTQELRILLKRYKSGRPWSNIADRSVKSYLEDTIEKLYDRVKIS